ncbi:MAG: 4Fe-4S binding protein [Clostridia bacterium]|nr:4Fe-4S binding protein [Clostridia bacterium]
MRTTVQMDKTCCTGCGACISVCPKQAIQMKMDDEGFYYPSVNENCIGCNRCENICPTGKLSSHAILSVLGGWNE